MDCLLEYLTSTFTYAFCDPELKRGGGWCYLTLMLLLLSVSPHPDYGGTVLPLTVTVPADSRHVNHLYARVFIVSASILDDLFITLLMVAFQHKGHCLPLELQDFKLTCK